MSVAIPFRISFSGCVRDIQSTTDKPAELRRLFNAQIDSALTRIQANEHEKHDASSWKHIPVNYRAWMESRSGKWLEIIDRAGMVEMLQDPTLIHDQNVRRVQFRCSTDRSPDSSPSIVPHSSVRRTIGFTPLPVDQLGPAPVNVIDPFLQEPIDQIQADDRVLIYQYQSGVICSLLLSASPLFAWIEDQISSGVSLFQVKVDAIGANNNPLSIECGQFVWGLLMSATRCPLAEDFRSLYIRQLNHLPVNAEAFSYIMKCSDLYDRIQYFVYDLLHLKHGAANLERGIGVDQIQFTQIYLSSFYFSESEMQHIAFFPLANGEQLIDRIKALSSDLHSPLSSDDRSPHICSSHDVAPIYRLAFRLENKFYGNESFSKKRTDFVKKRNKELAKQEASSLPTSQPSVASSSSSVLALDDDELAAVVSQLSMLDQKISKLGEDSKAQVNKLKLQKEKARIKQKYRLE